MLPSLARVTRARFGVSGDVQAGGIVFMRSTPTKVRDEFRRCCWRWALPEVRLRVRVSSCCRGSHAANSRRFPLNRDDLLSPKESGFSGRGSIALPLSYSPDGLVGVEPTTHGLTTESVSVCLPDECAFWNATSEREAKSQSGNATRGGAPWVNVHPAGFEPAVEGAGVEPERMALLD